ncbi:uncharacterized protein L3040_005001 [Drepanopeziza brunnea f. sp. 'multigermtubi']|uniref:uncharacterized protein n=1 Tax=Drepanopeziza brunnea f. sp. 'multigermtubi' TaxID=698441 RepID=UPI00239DA9A3|nr:hypothetical protein L3040_005001 [Drepanopeziza brunnea f. sp. 'multigermtubi']
MRFINVLFAATIIAIAHAEEPMPEWEDPDRNRKIPDENASGRMGILLVCEDPWWKNCENVTYLQDKCMGLGPYNLDDKMTGFDTYSYGCEFYGPGTCETDDSYFVWRGAVTDLLSTGYYKSNDQISSFRCGT